MGAYLSEPITKKMSSDECGKNVAFGASSMQGWRVSQEDAHNCCIDFDEETSLFAVYDGHGGHEVATYCAKELPDFIKNTEAYKNGDIKQALIDAFLGFDEALAKPVTIRILKEIAGAIKNDNNERKDNSFGSGDDDEESVSDLKKEAMMPLEQVMARYMLCQRGKENNKSGSQWPAGGPSCSSSSNTWSGEDKFGGSTSREFTSKREIEENERGQEASESSANGESSNGVLRPEIIENAAETKETKDDCKTTPDKDSEGSSALLENGDTKEHDSALPDEYRSLGKGKKTGRPNRTITRIARDQRRIIAKDNEDDDDDNDDDDDDDDENDETFDGFPVLSDDDTEEAEDDEEQEDSSDDEEDENDKEDDEEDDDEAEEDEEEDDGDFTMDMTEEPGSESGCTAVVAILHNRDLYVANAGDSRCVLCREGEALELSLDHKPEDEPEMERIVKAGGKVTADGRVNGGLNLSRALGDHAYKQNTSLPPDQQMISALPDVRHITIEPERDEFMILACDGIWNFMSSQEVVTFVRPRLANSETTNISKICEELFDHCLAADTMGDGTGCDNMTAVIVKFNNRNGSTLASSKKRPISPSEVASTISDKSDVKDAAAVDDSKSEEDMPNKRPKTEGD